MKKIFFLLMFISIYFRVNAQTDYYWYKDQKISLTKISDKKFILFEDSQDTTKLKKTIEAPRVKIEKYSDLYLSQSIKLYKNKQQKRTKWAVVADNDIANKKLTNNDKILYDANFYKNEKGAEIGLSHLFYVKLKSENDTIILDKLANEHKVEIVGNNKFMPLWFTLSCTKKSTGNALDMANLFYETGLFAASEPDLMSDDQPTCTNDPHFNDQWALNNTGQDGGTSGVDINFCQSRQITLGNQDIVIAILDHGFEMNHPDLANVYALSFDTESGTSPAQVFGSHGTACAGIIGATSFNNLGVSGIAPGCQIMSISNSLNGTPDSRQKRADGINFAWQNGASVISNSWASSVQYQMINDAINAALSQGRNGLGCVVVFSSGNDNTGVSYPANSNPEIIVVGAVDRCGIRSGRIDVVPNSCDPWPAGWSPGSCFGSQLDIVAPGTSVFTTDRQGVNGYNNNAGVSGDYNANFGGTSAACPHVAAVAGLILSKNPYITQQQVAEILESTAQKVGGYNYQVTAGRPNGTWDDEVGYGLVDAFAALQACPTAHIANETIEVDTEFNGCNIEVEAVEVKSNSKLTIDAENNIKITKDFKVELGSTLKLE